MTKCKYPPEGNGELVYNDNQELCLHALEEILAEGRIVEGCVEKCDSSYNLHVNFGGIKGIIPQREGAVGIAEGNVKNIALITRVGRKVCFKVTGLDYKNGSWVALLSRRKAQLEFLENAVSGFRAGDIIPCKITRNENFGSFCDLGCGVISLISIDNISISRIAHPKDRFAEGQDILAVVKTIEDSGRISLSHKELLGTWEQNALNYEVGQTVCGIVRSIESYGIFIELAPNLAGLAELQDGVSVGDYAAVYIKSIIPEKMKIKLVIADTYRAERVLNKTHYFITEGHIDHWKYSTEQCEKIIETWFE